MWWEGVLAGLNLVGTACSVNSDPLTVPLGPAPEKIPLYEASRKEHQ